MRWDAAQSPSQNARRVLPALAQEFFKAGRKVAEGKASIKEMHAFRLETKRFRYTVEIFEPVYGKELAALLNALRKVQQVLGETNDYRTVLDMEGVRENARFAAWLKLRRRGWRQRFRKVWRGLIANQERWLGYLGTS